MRTPTGLFKGLLAGGLALFLVVPRGDLHGAPLVLGDAAVQFETALPSLPETDYMETDEEELPPQVEGNSPPEKPPASNEQEKGSPPVKSEEEVGKKGDAATKTPEETSGETDKPEKKGVTILSKGAKAEEDDHRYTVYGGTLIHPEDRAFSLSLGVPEVRGLYHFALSSTMDLALGGSYLFGFNTDSIGDVHGGGIIGQFRWRVYSHAGHAISLTADPGLLFFSHDKRFGTGFVFGLPGVAWDYRIIDDWTVQAGISLPWGFFRNRGSTSFRLPILGRLGMEYAVSEDFLLFGCMQVGPDIWVSGYGDGVGLQLQALVGAAFLL